MRPILEYGHLVWDRGAVGITSQIERIHHTVTSMALGNPKWNMVGYHNYDERLMLLNRTYLKDRREVQGIIFCAKLLRGYTLSEVTTVVQPFLAQHTINTRNINIFNGYAKRLAGGDPIRRLMENVNKHRTVILFYLDAASTIKENGPLLSMRGSDGLTIVTTYWTYPYSLTGFFL